MLVFPRGGDAVSLTLREIQTFTNYTIQLYPTMKKEDFLIRIDMKKTEGKKLQARRISHFKSLILTSSPTFSS